MSKSTKSIISFIKGQTGNFSYQTLLNGLSQNKSERRSGKKKQAKRGHGQKKEQQKIDDTINALVSIGFLERHKKTYSRSERFRCSGIIKIGPRGEGILITEDGLEYIIKKDDVNNAYNNDDVEAELIDARSGVFFARVVSISKRKKSNYIARIEEKSKNQIFYRLIDIPGRVEVFSPRFGSEPDKGDLAVIQLYGKTVDGIQECRVKESHTVDDEEFDVRRIILKHALPEPHTHYEELDAIDKSYLNYEKNGRRDYTKLFSITIDGKNAKDFDDAISLEKTGSGYKLYVHIADVSAFVLQNTSLDHEAAKRGTSFYLGNSVIPMLPEILSNDLCSLKEGVERFTLSAEMSFDAGGMLTAQSFHRGIIKSDKRLTYTSAHDLIESGRKSKIQTLLKQMFELATLLKQRRMKQGRVDLNLTDSELIYEGNFLVDLIAAKRLKSHIIIEEFMLSANEAVSRALRENNIPALYRIHENISQEKLLALVKFLQTLNIPFKPKGNIGIALQEAIDRVKGKEYEEVVNFIILKSLMQAYYGVEPLGHFGLGFKDYTHFTSPIRRYPDLVVHRCLKSLIHKTTPPYTREALQPTGVKSSEMERLAQNAERDLLKLKSCRIMRSRIGEEFKAIISGIAKSGFFVTLLDKPVEGMVPLRFLTDDYYLVQEDDFTVIGKRLGRRFRLGDRVTVNLASVDIGAMRIDFTVKK